MNSQHKWVVAVVDDDALTRDLICSMLHALDYQTLPLDSAAALAKAQRASFSRTDAGPLDA